MVGEIPITHHLINAVIHLVHQENTLSLELLLHEAVKCFTYKADLVPEDGLPQLL